MVSQATIESRISAGYAKAAAKLGAYCACYRPNASDAAVSQATLLGYRYCAFDTAPDFPFVMPSKYGKPLYYLLADRTDFQVGDYIVDPRMGTFFIASLETLKAGFVVQCNRTLTFTRPGAGPAGADYYGGDQTATETPLLTGWPASVLQGTKGEAGDTKLPGDTRLAWVQILIPALAGVQLRAADIAVDDQTIPQRYVVSSTELTGLGYRLTASLALT